MTRTTRIRAWKTIALLATVFALLFLLLPHQADHSTAVLFLLIPIFLFAALIDEACTYSPPDYRGFAATQDVTATLFQRPPPSQA